MKDGKLSKQVMELINTMNEDNLDEMARLGIIGDLDLRIYHEPLKNPSFHIVHKDFEVVIQIKDLSVLEVKRLSKSKYRFTKGHQLPVQLLKVIKSFMDMKDEDLPSITNKENLVPTWNKNNQETKISIDYIEW